MTRPVHLPVLREEALALLDIHRPGLYIDATVGMAGHAAALLGQNPEAELVGIDRDADALEAARTALSPFADRALLYQADFRGLPDLPIDLSRVRGVLFDLGVSSLQLDDPERGFSFNREGPLDMRMDRRAKTTAARLLNKISEPRLAEILYGYGELRQARKLARAIVSRRKLRPIASTRQLFHIVEEVCRWRPQKGKTHPAARVFQAIRIEVNRELEGLDDFWRGWLPLLPPGARVAVISFHSLEDRIVKTVFSDLSSPDMGPACLTLLTRRPIRPAAEEVDRNFRARSAKLRGAERI